jgi:hypothetical protein
VPFRDVTKYVTMPQALYIPSFKETAKAKKCLEARAHGQMPWRNAVNPSTVNART